MAQMTAEREATFTALFDAHFDAVLAYARRRTAQLSDAEDLAAETFTVAWRRLDRLPPQRGERLPWLYGIARRVLANQRRGASRRLRLVDRLRGAVRSSATAPALDIGSAMAALAPADQEVLRLVVWESLTHAEAGVVLGISPNAVAIRVHRARERLRRAMKGVPHSRTFPEWKGSVRRPTREEVR